MGLNSDINVIYANINAYWDGISVSNAAAYVDTIYQKLQSLYPGKEVVISETGWPSAGAAQTSHVFTNPQQTSIPGLANEQAYWQNFLQIANQQNISFGAFEAYDEPEKDTSSPTAVENNWGLISTNSGPTYTGSTFKTSITSLEVSCFLRGTNIATPAGERTVETLQPGDLVLTASGEACPIVWIGRRSIDARDHRHSANVWPVRVRAGALAENCPHRDLYLSPDHAVFVDGVLIPIKHLINDISIAQTSVDEVTYYHIELPQHDVLLAEGLAAESYLDTGDRSKFENAGAVVALYPDLSDLGLNAGMVWEAYGCAPLILCGPLVEAVRHRTKFRAADHAAWGQLELPRVNQSRAGAPTIIDPLAA
jgi:hypothetical protein